MRADSKPRTRSRGLSSLALIGGAVALCVVLAMWSRVNWAWSPVDDAGHVLALEALMNESGLLVGMARYAMVMFEIDLSWGLFRPSYWLYPSLFYLLPTGPAHVARLIMVLLVIIGPLIHFYRRGIRGAKLFFVAVLLVTSGSALYIGLFLVSLQELSGLAFIGLGLLVRNRWLRWILWTIAAWFKVPFAWLLIGQAIVDWRRGDRKLAVANGGVGVATLVLAVLMSRSGSYTSQYSLEPFAIWFNAQNLLEPINVVILISAFWWLVVLQGRITWTSDTTVFAIGWIGYTFQLLPWSVTAYYMGPISFLFGLTLASMMRLPGSIVTPIKALVGWSVPVILGTIVVTDALLLGFRINGAMYSIQSCLEERRGSSAVLQGDLVYVTSSPEAPIRIKQNLQLLEPMWEGTLTLVDPQRQNAIPPNRDYLINVGAPLAADEFKLVTVCESQYAQTYRRANS